MSTRLARSLVAVVSVAALITGALAALPTNPAAQAAPRFAVSGIDIASWQHPGGAPIDWGKVKRAGHSFALIKATESTTYTNPYYASDRRGAQSAGLVVGAYHFAQPKLPLASAEAQARYFVKVVGTQQLSRTLPPVLDLESTNGLSKEQVAQWAKRWLRTVESLTGRTPMLYSYDSFLRNRVASPEDFRGYPLWYARYQSTPPAALPGAWPRWHIWQYTSSGKVPGIEGRVDVNWFNGSHSQLLTFATGRVPASLRQSNVQRSESTSLSGRVDPAYAGAQVVRREQRKNGTWVTRKTKRVSADGTYSFTVRPTTKRTRAYRVYLYSSTPYARVRSVTVKLKVVDPWAKASLSRTKVRKGKRVQISGRVDTFYAGERILRQKRTGNGSWKTQKTGRVGDGGRFRFWVKPSSRGTHQYRVALRATKPTARATSRTLTLKVR